MLTRAGCANCMVPTLRDADDGPFDIRAQRAMVSLGPLSAKKYCTYSCPFCYVKAGFKSYHSMQVEEITDWIRKQTATYDIIYVSGDTDSFAAPRTALGIDLLDALAEFDRDLLFTTRAVFSTDQLDRISKIASRLRSRGRLLFGCTSVCQLSYRYLEPKPIAGPRERLAQVNRFTSAGLVSVLAMRPFLPVVPASEYIRILDLCGDAVDIVLGEAWFSDSEGKLERGVFRSPTPSHLGFTIESMDFDSNKDKWKVFDCSEVEMAVSAHCRSRSIPFFMRSRPAVEWARTSYAAR